jgi:signal transduction histidine kinase
MRAPIYKNMEYRVLMAAVTAVILVFLCLSLLITHFTWTRLKNSVTESNLALLGSLLEAYPGELDPEARAAVIRSFTREPGAGNLAAGQAAAAAYGYTRELPFSANPILNRWYLTSLGTVAGLGALLFLGLLGAVYLVSDRTYRKLGGYILGTERIMRGDYHFHFPDTGEGEMAMLGFQLNQLSRRLQLSFAALQTEKQLIKEMASGISHQLKTPLASSRVFVELLLDGAAEDPEVRREFLQKNLAQLERMEWLIQSLLKISRLEAGVIEFQKTYEDLAKTLAKVISSLADSAAENGQALELNTGEEPVPVPHDCKWLSEALINIIDNAIRHTPRQGRITVSLEQAESIAVLTVGDTGPGIPAEELPRIFERFYQGSSSGDGPRQGSGIGLTLAKLIIEKHGGVVQVTSARDKGTTFTVTLPRTWLS